MRRRILLLVALSLPLSLSFLLRAVRPRTENASTGPTVNHPTTLSSRVAEVNTTLANGAALLADYCRPHSAHGWLTLVEFVEAWFTQQQLTLAQRLDNSRDSVNRAATQKLEPQKPPLWICTCDRRLNAMRVDKLGINWWYRHSVLSTDRSADSCSPTRWLIRVGFDGLWDRHSDRVEPTHDVLTAALPL